MAQSETIRRWHVVIAGFTQHEGRPNGMAKLWWELHRRHHAAESVVTLREWNFHPKHLAEMIWRMADDQEPPQVAIYGYSWGGFSSTLLARELGRRGLAVRAMVLCDAVYRHWYALGQWRALVPWSRIVIPKNVREVFWFRQQTDLPQGHRLVPENGHATVIHPAVRLVCSHAYCDDAPAFHRKSLEVAEAIEGSGRPKWPHSSQGASQQW